MTELRSRPAAGFPDSESQGCPEDVAPQKRYACDLCGAEFDGAPDGSGLFVWTRGGEVRYEEPPLCEACSSRIAFGALYSFSEEEDEE
ncbi:MAG TPA: hypothetical protein VF989_04100 [Polyangiaceae bacterium]|jgi:DNA-directed RNA polymerase subunit RPC12/RpoP